MVTISTDRFYKDRKGTPDFKRQKSKQKKQELQTGTPKKSHVEFTSLKIFLKALNDIIRCTLFGGTLFSNYAAGIRGHHHEIFRLI